MENEYEFEFGCITPASPSSDPNKTVSPADQFFLNGRLLPHSFPVQSTKSPASETQSRATTSRASSIGSSLMSSRSNSTSSNRSGTTSCSSARTSASDASERKAFQKKLARERLYGSYGSPASAPQSWQFISPAPVLATGVSRRRRISGELGLKGKSQSSKKKKRNVSGEKLGFCQRVLNSFVMSCRACHAMDPGAVLERDDFGSHLELK